MSPILLWMRAESNDGGLKLDNETADTEKGARTHRRKVIAAVVVLMIVLVSIGILAVLLRPWKITEIAEKVVGPPGAPGFQTDLAGTTVVVAGKVTNITSYETTLGPLTFIELDGFNLLHLVEWKEPTFKVGDTISREVRFEWSQINDQVRVMSPQLDFPGLVTIPSLGGVTAATSCIAGICPIEKNDESSDAAIIEILLRRSEGFPLNLFNATIRKGLESWSVEYIAVIGQYNVNPEIDFIGSLEDGIGEKGELGFVDANSNGLLDDEDYFKVNLTRPSENSAVYTYLLMINRAEDQGTNLLGGTTYIAMTNRGTLRFLATPTSISYPFSSGVRMELVTETETPIGITAEIVISEMWGPPLPIPDSNCYLRYGRDEIVCAGLREGLVASSGNFSITFTDVNNDGTVDSGDLFTITGLENHAGHRFELTMHTGNFCHYGNFCILKWITGVGIHTAYLPVIEWNDPVALDYPLNLTFTLQIKRMYGIPGVLLGDLEERMVVDVKRNGSLILMSANLTQDFNYTSTDLNITFEDADDNGYLNTGDFFLCTSSGPADYEMILGYVNDRHEEYDQPFISWPVSWQTN